MKFKILCLIMMTSLLTMCKSKENVEILEPIQYTVLLTEGTTVKALAVKIDHKITDAKLSSKSQNQWTINFQNVGKKSQSIKKDLLALDIVLTVYDDEQLQKMESKSVQKSKVSPVSKN